MRYKRQRLCIRAGFQVYNFPLVVYIFIVCVDSERAEVMEPTLRPGPLVAPYIALDIEFALRTQA